MNTAVDPSNAEGLDRQSRGSHLARSIVAIGAYVVGAGAILYLNQHLWWQLIVPCILLGMVWGVIVVRFGPPTRSTRFAFSLRTLFVVLTVLCVWIGWNVNIVQNRRTALADIESSQVTSFTFAEGSADFKSASENRAKVIAFILSERHVGQRFPSTRPCEVSTLRHWLGDEPMFRIVLKDDSELARVRRLFPEAQINVMDAPGTNDWNAKPSGQPLDISKLPPGELKDDEVERLRLLFPGEL